jgi:polysaccharide biosynthesis PFTS motif protein
MYIFTLLSQRTLRRATHLSAQGHLVYYAACDHEPPGNGLRSLPRCEFPVVGQGAAIALTEAIFNACALGSLHHMWVRKFLNSSDSDLAMCGYIKHELGLALDFVERACEADSGIGRSIYVEGVSPFLAELASRYQKGLLPESVVDLIPAPIRKTLGNLKFEVQWGHAIKSAICDLVRACGHLVLHARLRIRREWIPFAIRTYPMDLHLPEVNRFRTVDFLVDGDKITKDNVIFFADGPIAEEKRRVLTDKGYRIILASDIVFDLKFLLRAGFKNVLSFVVYRVRSTLQDSWFAGAGLHFYYRCQLSAAFAEYFRPNFFIAYNDLSYGSTIRNIVLRQHGCRSVFLMHSCNWTIGEDGKWVPHRSFAYLLFDILVSWGEMETSYHKRHPGRFDEIWELGCLWSEHVRQVHEDGSAWDKYSQGFFDQLSTKSRPDRIVAIMDTSITPALGLSEDDLYAFLLGCLEVVQDFPEVLFLYKPKNPFSTMDALISPLVHSYGERGRQLQETMVAKPNFVLLPGLFETSVVSGLADLTISACFTSPTVEAIGMGKKGLYFDPTLRFPQAFWNDIPGMVCRDVGDLKNRMQALLYECDEDQYREYLSLYLKQIDSYLDGYSISRLRQLLAAEISAY